MNYPTSMQIGANTIKVEVLNEPIKRLGPNSAIIGCYEAPTRGPIKQYHDDQMAEACGASFVHETIEAVDSICDLKLTHTQITTLAEMMYQAFRSGQVCFN